MTQVAMCLGREPREQGMEKKGQWIRQVTLGDDAGLFSNALCVLTPRLLWPLGVVQASSICPAENVRRVKHVLALEDVKHMLELTQLTFGHRFNQPVGLGVLPRWSDATDMWSRVQSACGLPAGVMHVTQGERTFQRDEFEVREEVFDA